MPLPANQLPIGEGRHPNGDPGATFYIDVDALTAAEEDGPEWKYEDARFILEAVAEPDAIFEGLRRHDHEGGLCYSVRPTHDPDDESSQEQPRYGFVFVAFVRPGLGGYVVFDWEWREEDFDFPGHPENWENDLTRRTWHKT